MSSISSLSRLDLPAAPSVTVSNVYYRQYQHIIHTALCARSRKTVDRNPVVTAKINAYHGRASFVFVLFFEGMVGWTFIVLYVVIYFWDGYPRLYSIDVFLNLYLIILIILIKTKGKVEQYF